MPENEGTARIHSFPDGRDGDRITLGGDEFLDAVIESVSVGDTEKRAWARTMVEHEGTVANFVASVRVALRGVREARGLSIEEAAEQVGVSPSALSRLETGATAEADLKLVARAALMLGVAPRLDFAARGTPATVSVSGLERTGPHADEFRDLDQSPITPRAVAGNGTADADPPSGSAAQDPTALDQRIRDLEARIAAMEPPKPENSE